MGRYNVCCECCGKAIYTIIEKSGHIKFVPENPEHVIVIENRESEAKIMEFCDLKCLKRWLEREVEE